MTISSKYQSLISALLDATAERRIKWEMTNTPNEFQTVINKNTVSVCCYEHNVALVDRDNKPRYSLQLKNKDGVIIVNYAGESPYTRKNSSVCMKQLADLIIKWKKPLTR